MVVVNSLVAIYYNMIIGWSIYYLFASFTSELPWEKCQAEWATDLCIDYVKLYHDDWTQCDRNGWVRHVPDDGACYTTNDTIKAIWNQALASANGIRRTLPSAEYYERRVLGMAFSDGIQDLGPIRWEIVLCYLFAFILVITALCKSIKSLGKVVYFTATFPFVVLLILLIRGLLYGHKDGIDFYITPRIDRLCDVDVWIDAFKQVIFSLSVSWGGLIALASYNRFHNDILRDTIAVLMIDFLTSVVAGFVMFSYIGKVSTDLNVSIYEVATSGPTLAFIVYPYAVTKMSLSPLWSILFFLMLLTLGLDTQFVIVQTVTTGLMDRFPKIRRYKFLTVTACCTVFFLLGLTLTTNGGVYMLELLDTYIGGWEMQCILICECISISYIYGIRRFLQDIECMIGNTLCGWLFRVTKYWWALMWCVVTPAGVTGFLIFSWVKYKDIKGEAFPDWTIALGWMMTLTVIFAIVGGAIVTIWLAEGDFSQRMRYATKPTVDWGPFLVQHRAEVERYRPWFVVDPRRGDVQHDPPGNTDEITFELAERLNHPTTAALMPDSMHPYHKQE